MKFFCSIYKALVKFSRLVFKHVCSHHIGVFFVFLFSFLLNDVCCTSIVSFFCTENWVMAWFVFVIHLNVSYVPSVADKVGWHPEVLLLCFCCWAWRASMLMCFVSSCCLVMHVGCQARRLHYYTFLWSAHKRWQDHFLISCLRYRKRASTQGELKQLLVAQPSTLVMPSTPPTEKKYHWEKQVWAHCSVRVGEYQTCQLYRLWI